MKSSDQSARTYKTEVIKDSTRKNSLGEDYVYLKAWCYMPRIKKNEELIEEIKAGIIKEVSVGCAVKSCVCSVCGKELGKSECSHVRGGVYDGSSVTVSCKIPRTHTSGRLSPYLHRKTPA